MDAPYEKTRKANQPYAWKLVHETSDGWKTWEHRQSGEKVLKGPDGQEVNLTHDILIY